MRKLTEQIEVRDRCGIMVCMLYKYVYYISMYII